jgi:cytochrome P450
MKPFSKTRTLITNFFAKPGLSCGYSLIDRLVRQRQFDGVCELSETFPMQMPGGWGMQVFEAADRGECTEQEAERLVRSFLSAGVDTTVNGIGHMLLAFATHPEAWQQVRENRPLSRSVFDESLRWDSTVRTFFRTTVRDVTVADHVITEGSKVLLFLAAANRDPRHWENPEHFDPGRKNSGHVGFGYGLHQCLGQMVARQEAEVVLNSMLARVKAIRLAGPVIRRLNNTLHAMHSLPIDVTPLD